MRQNGLIITHLTLKGKGVQDADVQFGNGLNVISGPSDTGKTFIAQCINFMMGGSKTPKDILEAAPYETILLGLRSKNNDSAFTLERSLRGGDFHLHLDKKNARILDSKHQPGKEDTVSHFFLSLSGLVGKKVRINMHGETRALSFRDITKLILIDEETIISERSPILSGQILLKTTEAAVFRLLLTGIDDSSIIAKDNPKAAKIRQEVKTEVIELLLERKRSEIDELKFDGDADTLREGLARIDVLFQDANSELDVEQESLAALEESRRNSLVHLQEVESKIVVLSELQSRFELLQKQYISDLRRLESIAEAGVRLGQLKEERCPVCGALAEHHDKEHQNPRSAPEEVGNACKAEAQKIRALHADLQETIVDNSIKIKDLIESQSANRTLLKSAEIEIQNNIHPRLQKALQSFREIQKKRDRYRHALGLYERVQELETMLEEIESPKRNVRNSKVDSTDVGTHQTEQFSREAEAILRAWHFPNLDRVTFSDKDQDLVISGRSRDSHGKGVRAITHAAFNVAILKYCLSKSMPHPGVVIIDSPLVVYREPDINEVGFSRDVKDAFYRMLATSFGDAQIIILENEDPPNDVALSTNVIKFTGTIHGRYGFIPCGSGNESPTNISKKE